MSLLNRVTLWYEVLGMCKKLCKFVLKIMHPWQTIIFIF